MEYIINIWKRSHTNGTSVFYRGTDRAEFQRKKRAAVKLLHPYKEIARTVVYEDNTFFSFASCADGFDAWAALDFIKKPLAIKYEKTGDERG